ncbi:hypothetical protein [Winogradskyella flava]|uniref:Uncharacterized protein n=1 Tax=Winogradskyella flava TaxID=1884876 RepID=A0A842ITH9_9FLAO|nr:hypothetical protein [Winogradskyella flava]MBC2846482.1 hypothetical protein [Winogradskyella flava]
MKSKMLNELPELLEHKVISEDVASNIRQYYQTYALVAVKNGEAVLKDVLINDKSIKDYIEKEDTQ